MFKLYALIAATVMVLGLGTTLYVKGRADAAEKAVIVRLKDTIANREAALSKYREAYSADQEQAKQASARASALNTKIADLRSKLKDPSKVCLEAEDTVQLRSLWQ